MVDKATEIVKVEDYAVVKVDQERLREVYAENLGTTGLSQFDLERIKMPSSGAMAFERMDAAGNPNYEKTITGILIAHLHVRTFWRNSFAESGGSSPPDCTSRDQITGIGDPGGACATCPFSQFGSAMEGRAQACQARCLIFILEPKRVLPAVLNAPPTSLKNLRKYMRSLIGGEQPLPHYAVLTAFGLEKAVNKTGRDYSRITFQILTALPEAMIERMATIKRELVQMLMQTNVATMVTEAVDSESEPLQY